MHPRGAAARLDAETDIVNPLDLRAVAVALGGEVNGRQVLAPGPGHTRLDRSLSVRLSSTAPGGFVVQSFAGDDFALCRDYVSQRLGMNLDAWRTRSRGGSRPAPVFAVVEGGETADHAGRIARARALWAEAVPAQGTVVERYLAGRGLELPPGADALRFHPVCPWRDEQLGRTVFVPAMVACMRQAEGNLITGVHRTRLTPDGVKVDRRMLGVAAGAAIKLDGDAEVTTGLHIGEGVETVQQGRQLGMCPGWALGSAGAIAGFPVLPGVEILNIHAERDPTNARAVDTCAARWYRAGRTVFIIEPRRGSDLNDAVRARAS